MIEIKNLSVSIGPVAILHSVNLSAPAGSLVGVVGHNGAGKTTLMRAMVGLLPVTRGELLLDSQPSTGASVQERVILGLGYMPEDRRLVPDLSVRENIMLPMEVRRMADAQGRLARAIDWIPELHPLIDRKGSQLSGGQQKLAALARAICCGTRILLLDEPFEGVAPALVERLTEVLKTLRTTGPTILFTDSDGAHLAGLCDARYEIERGALRPVMASSQEASHAV